MLPLHCSVAPTVSTPTPLHFLSPSSLLSPLVCHFVPCFLPHPKASLGPQYICKMVVSFPSGSLKIRICIEYPYDHSVYGKMGHRYNLPHESGRTRRTVTKGLGTTNQEEAKCSPLGSEASEAAPHPSSPFLAFLMVNSPIFVILTITSTVGTTISPFYSWRN